MKHIFLLLICAFMAISCTTTEQQAPTYQAEDVEAAVELFRQLMVNPNEEQLQQITADQLTYGHSNGLIESKSECIEAMVSGKFKFTSVALSEQTIDMSDNVAIVRHILTGDTHNAGQEPGTAHLKVLQVWQHIGGEWKLVSRQAVKIVPQS